MAVSNSSRPIMAAGGHPISYLLQIESTRMNPFFSTPGSTFMLFIQLFRTYHVNSSSSMWYSLATLLYRMARPSPINLQSHIKKNVYEVTFTPNKHMSLFDWICGWQVFSNILHFWPIFWLKRKLFTFDGAICWVYALKVGNSKILFVHKWFNGREFNIAEQYCCWKFEFKIVNKFTFAVIPGIKSMWKTNSNISIA